MIINDVKKEFYETVKHSRVLILVALDVDSLCACKILQTLFQCDEILYTIVPVTGEEELQQAFVENSEGIQYIVMLNCGAMINVVEELQPEDNMVFYICDSHRPVEVHNIYNQIQVRMLIKHDENDAPQFTDVFREDEEDSSDDSGVDSDDSSDPGAKRKRITEESLERRRERRLWAEKRQKIIYDYTEFSYYGSSSALQMFELAWKLSKDTNDLLWLAIIGVTDQYQHQRIDRDKYIDDINFLQGHVLRLNPRSDDDNSSLSVDSLRIKFDNELQLTLYRHWTVYHSLMHTSTTAAKFKVWTMKGQQKLQEFLADMGLPLVECQQKYISMETQVREKVKDMIAQLAEKYNFLESELFLPSFYARYGYKNLFCAADVMYACEALLESVKKDHTASGDFLVALDVLSRSKTDIMEQGLEDAKLKMHAVVNQVQSFLGGTSPVISAGPFLYGFVEEGCSDVRFFTKPLCLQKLARFTLHAYCAANSRNKRAHNLPLVLGAPMDMERGTLIVIGIPPASETTGKNFFGKAFEQAAKNSKSRSMHDNFETNIIELKREDKSKFFDALIDLLS